MSAAATGGADAVRSGGITAGAAGAADAEPGVRTACPYCGVGCGLIAHTAGGRLERVEGDALHPVNRGRTCAKPLALPSSVHAPDRALTPLRRETREHRWREAGWDDTLGWLAGRLREIVAESGPESIAFYISGQLLTEDYYAVNKLAKGFLGTNNVDSNSRLCMSSAVAGYEATFGADGPPASYADLALTDCFLVLGSNTAACHPIVWGRVRDRQREGASVIVVDPRRTETARAADLHLPVRPGTDLALLSAMLHVLARSGLASDHGAEGYEEMMAAADGWPPERAAEVCGVPAEDIVEAAQRFGEAPGAMALWSMGANQSSVGTLKNRALHALCVVTGNLGRPGTGPLSLTGQPNAMGGREVGGLAHLLPGYRHVASAEDRAAMADLWRLPRDGPGICATPGLPAVELFDALADGRVRAVWICATNPVVSLPESARVREALARADLVVVQDAFHPTETSALADVVLPAAAWPEKEGTMTNSERRVSLVRRALAPPGQARPDWEVFAGLGRALGFGEHFAWESAAEVFDEFAATTAGRPCDQSGIDHARLRREGSLQWPCPAQDPALGPHPGTERLYAGGRCHAPGGRARLVALEHAEPAEGPDGTHPLVLTTGRVANQWHTMTRTAKAPELMAADPEPFVEIHPCDARAAGVRDGAMARVCSRRGSVLLRARVLDSVPPGTLFAPFHWGALHAPAGAGALNEVTNGAVDAVSRQPELKACAVRVEPVAGVRRAGGAPASSASSRPRRLVVVGAGMAAQATIEAALSHRPDGWEITMLGREPEHPYNRVKLSELLTPGHSEERLRLRPPDWFEARGITVRTGLEARTLDVDRRRVQTADGDELPYDRLLLATGSRPLVPPIAGIERDGVHLFRTLADTRAIIAGARRARTAAVIGGGLLGLEAARGLIALGLEVTVVHLVDRLMETQLDQLSSALVERRMRALGVRVLRGRATREITADGLRFADGEQLQADLVVISVGIRPDVALARAAGLEVGRAIQVDDELRTSAPGVWAVGECAEHRGKVYGLWAPLLQQSRAAGATLAGAPAAFHGAVPATTLKVMGVELFCAGRHSAQEDEDELVVLDSRAGIYRKLVLRDRELVGAILVGDLSLSPRLGELLHNRRPVPDELLTFGASAGDPAPEDEHALVCTCNAVAVGTILSAIRARDLRTVDQVAQTTRATTGCGSCAPRVAALLGAARRERESEGLAAARGGRGATSSS